MAILIRLWFLEQPVRCGPRSSSLHDEDTLRIRFRRGGATIILLLMLVGCQGGTSEADCPGPPPGSSQQPPECRDNPIVRN